MSETHLKGWNHPLEIPLKVSSFFEWPPNPVAVAKWIWQSWFLITERLICFGIAALCYLSLSPTREDAKTFEASWIAQLYARTFVLPPLIARGFQGLLVCDKRRLGQGTFHHQTHPRCKRIMGK